MLVSMGLVGHLTQSHSCGGDHQIVRCTQSQNTFLCRCQESNCMFYDKNIGDDGSNIYIRTTYVCIVVLSVCLIYSDMIWTNEQHTHISKSHLATRALCDFMRQAPFSRMRSLWSVVGTHHINIYIYATTFMHTARTPARRCIYS